MNYLFLLAILCGSFILISCAWPSSVMHPLHHREKKPKRELSELDMKKDVNILMKQTEMERLQTLAYYLYKDDIDEVARVLHNKKTLMDAIRYLQWKGFWFRSKNKNLIDVILPIIKTKTYEQRVNDYIEEVIERNSLKAEKDSDYLHTAVEKLQNAWKIHKTADDKAMSLMDALYRIDFGSKKKFDHSEKKGHNGDVELDDLKQIDRNRRHSNDIVHNQNDKNPVVDERKADHNHLKQIMPQPMSKNGDKALHTDLNDSGHQQVRKIPQTDATQSQAVVLYRPRQN